MQRVKPPAKVVAVRGPDGSVLTLDDLPPAQGARWVARRKAELVAAVRGGLITLDEACRRYRLSEEEFRRWRDIYAREGTRALSVRRSQLYRKQRVKKDDEPG
jgi:hypothetical protein